MPSSSFDSLMICWASIWRLCVKECEQSLKVSIVSLWFLFFMSSVVLGLQDNAHIVNLFSVYHSRKLAFDWLLTRRTFVQLPDWQRTLALNDKFAVTHNPFFGIRRACHIVLFTRCINRAPSLIKADPNSLVMIPLLGQMSGSETQYSVKQAT